MRNVLQEHIGTEEYSIRKISDGVRTLYSLNRTTIQCSHFACTYFYSIRYLRHKNDYEKLQSFTFSRVLELLFGQKNTWCLMQQQNSDLWHVCLLKSIHQHVLDFICDWYCLLRFFAVVISLFSNSPPPIDVHCWCHLQSLYKHFSSDCGSP